MKEEKRIVREIRSDKQTPIFRQQGPAGDGDHVGPALRKHAGTGHRKLVTVPYFVRITGGDS